MSVVRFSDESDVPISASNFECCGCKLHSAGCVTCKGIEAAKEHLLKHKAAGQKVPDSAFADLDFRRNT